MNSGDGKTIWLNKSRGSPTSTNHMRSYQFAAGMLFASPQMSMCLPFKRTNKCSLHSAEGSGVEQFKMAGGEVLGDLEGGFRAGKTQGSIITDTAFTLTKHALQRHEGVPKPERKIRIYG